MSNKLNLINLGYNPWSNFWKRNQTITYLLSEMGMFQNALFLHSPVWLIDLFKNPIREFHRPQINKWRTIIPKKVSPKITAFTPMYLPYKNKIKAVREINNFFNKVAIKKYIESHYILMINDPQADQEIVSDLIEKSILTIFDWSDDFVEFSENELERKICFNTCKKYCEKSDLVITINDKLNKRAREFNDNVFTVRNATNYFTFNSSAENHKKMAHKIRKFGSLVVGYIGWLNSMRLDQEIIEYLATTRSDLNFVFIGPKSEEKPLGDRVPTFPNVHILPPIPYSGYPACLSALDVCILPNKISAHTEGNDPIKIYDYLASGRPTVATCTAGTEYFKDHLYLARNKYEFLECLNKALNEKSASLSLKRQNIAKEHSWQKRITEMSNIIMPFLESQSKKR
jgi:hypothetical protein